MEDYNIGDEVDLEEAEKLCRVGGQLHKVEMWVIDKLPPTPVPTAEELLKEGYQLVIRMRTSVRCDFNYSAFDTEVSVWLDRAYKHLEGNR
ncbi:MAG: hypothetical protein EHM79_00200 [Geobacter sp.]|nr:MAG: hypothetical protein EHM79_00200 [Geobacter sp.]